MSAAASRWVSLGRIGRTHGVAGWCWLRSDCDPADALFGYQPLRLRQGDRLLELSFREWRELPKGLIASIEGLSSPEAVQPWVGAVIETPRDALPDGEGWYWTDLEGLQVESVDGQGFGEVSHLFDAGGGAVMVVRGDRERLIPFVLDDVVRQVDLTQGRIVVDWDPDF